MDPLVARKTWRTLEPIHGCVYFAPRADEFYSAIGLTGSRTQYFGSRAAAMGPVPAEVVIATFYNFSPDLVRASIPQAWTLSTVEEILAARRRLVEATLTDVLGADIGDSPEVEGAARLAREIAERAVATATAGRPLFAGHAAQPWPETPLMQLWQAQTLLREYRGDGHLAALVLADLDPVEALVTHAASGEVPAEVLRTTRAWAEDAWNDGVERLRGRGLVAPDALTLTSDGAALRTLVEDRTDAAATAPYAAAGEETCARLRELARPLSRQIVTSGVFGFGASTS